MRLRNRVSMLLAGLFAAGNIIPSFHHLKNEASNLLRLGMTAKSTLEVFHLSAAQQGG